MRMTPQVIVALDVPSRREALEVVRGLGPDQEFYKVGLELFTRAGPSVVTDLVGMNKRVFLDLKLHDIPATVARAASAARDLGVDMLTVHVTGGERMVAAARDAVGDHVRLLGITVLTSLSRRELATIWGGGSSSMRNEVGRLAGLAGEWGLGGVVASALEASIIPRPSDRDFRIVTPGIRGLGQPINDQARVSTPEMAVKAGADYLVMGRPITRSRNPSVALARVTAEIAASVGG